MSVAHVATGSRSAGGTTSDAPAYPAGVSANRLALLSRVIKPDTATGSTPAGYTNQADVTGGTGATGIDVGLTRAIVDFRVLTGSETGSVTCTQANSPNSVHGVIQLYSCSAGSSWQLASSTGGDNVHGTGRNVTGTTSISLQPGDVVVAVCGSDTDTTTAFTSPAITASGITFGTATQRLGAGGVTTGNDTGLHIIEATVTAGTGTVAPTLSLASGPSNCGPVAFVRLRQGPVVIAVGQAIESEVANFPSVKKVNFVNTATETAVAQDIVPAIVHYTVDVDWRTGDTSRFTKILWSADGTAASTQTIDPANHQLLSTTPTTDTGDEGGSNLRESFILNETAGWRDGFAQTTFGPHSTFGFDELLAQNINPQHGLVYRYQEDVPGDKKLGISIWQNIVGLVNTNLIVGVWKSNMAGTAFNNRQAGIAMPSLTSRPINFSGATRTSGVVTATATSSTALYSVGSPIGVAFPGTDFDGRFYVTYVDATTLKWNDARADGTASGAGSGNAAFPYDVECRVHGPIIDVRCWPTHDPASRPEWTNHDPTAGIDFPGGSGNFVDTPDSVDFDNFSGDITLWADFTPSTWPVTGTQTLIGRYTTGSNNRHFRLIVNSSGIARVQLSQTGAFTNADFASSALTLINGRLCIWAECDLDNGASGKTCNFYVAPTVDDYANRVLLNSHTLATALPSIFSGATVPVELGSINAGATDIYTGRLHAAGARTGLALTGTPYLDWHAGMTQDAATSWGDRASPASKTWTPHGTAAMHNPGMVNNTLGFSIDTRVPGTEAIRTEAPSPVGIGKVGITMAHGGSDPRSIVSFGPVFATNATMSFDSFFVDAAVATEIAQAITVVVSGGGVARAMDGALEAVADTVAALSTARPIAGTSDAVADTVATLGVARPIAGVSDAVADTVATAVVARGLTSTSDAVADTSAALSRAMVGTIWVLNALSVTVLGQRTINGCCADYLLAFTVNGDADITRGLVGTSDAVASMDATITLSGQTALTGASDAVADMTGTLTTSRPIAGTLDAVADMTGTITRIRQITATLDAVGDHDATLSFQRGMAGTADLVADTVAVLVLTRALAGTLDAAVSMDASLALARPLAGALDAVAEHLASLSIGGPIIYVPPPIEVALFDTARAQLLDTTTKVVVIDARQAAALVDSSGTVIITENPKAPLVDTSSKHTVTDPSSKVSWEDD